MPGCVGHDRAGRLDAVEDGHLQVHHRHVGAVLAHQGHRLAAVLGDADHLEVVGGLDQAGQPASYDGMVVGQHHADHATGTSTLTIVPEPGRGLDLQGAAVLAHQALGGAQPEVLAARRRVAASNPTPSSTTSSTRTSSLAADGERHPRRLRVADDVAHRLLRDPPHQRHGSRRGVLVAGDVHVDLHPGGHQRRDEVVDGRGQPGGVQVGRVDLDQQRAQRAHAHPQRPTDLLQLVRTPAPRCARRGSRAPSTSRRGPGRRRRAGRARSAGVRRRRRGRRPRAGARAPGRPGRGVG